MEEVKCEATPLPDGHMIRVTCRDESGEATTLCSSHHLVPDKEAQLKRVLNASSYPCPSWPVSDT